MTCAHLPRVCSDCGTAISRQSKTGRCHLHAMRHLHADPGYQANRLDGLGRYFDTPGAREAVAARLASGRETMSEEARERRREHGRRQVRDYLSQPEIHARSQTPAARAAAIAGNDRAKMGWCPAELRPAYHALIRGKRIPATEARRIIEAEIAGTAEHARREIASRDLATRLREERRQMEAY